MPSYTSNPFRRAFRVVPPDHDGSVPPDPSMPAPDHDGAVLEAAVELKNSCITILDELAINEAMDHNGAVLEAAPVSLGYHSCLCVFLVGCSAVSVCE